MSLSQRVSLLSRLFQRFKIGVSTRCVGQDLQGNKYYESAGKMDGWRTKRSVKYYQEEDVWDYIGGGKRLPIQWSSWLSHTRQQPPSLEELQADYARQQRVLANVALIEQRDREEREQMLRLRGPDQLQKEASSNPPGASAEPSALPLTHVAEQEIPTAEKVQEIQEEKVDRKEGLPKMAKKDDYEPESWTPRVGIRRGSS